MDWTRFGIALLSWVYLMSIVTTILLIGKERKPLTQGTAAILTIFDLAVIVVLMSAWVRLA